MRNFIKNPHFDGFKDLADMRYQFQHAMPYVVPLWCVYNKGDHDGVAECWFEEHGRLMYVSASHCSCHGLERQWDKETYSLAQFERRTEFATGLPAEFFAWCKRRYDADGARKGVRDAS